MSYIKHFPYDGTDSYIKKNFGIDYTLDGQHIKKVGEQKIAGIVIGEKTEKKKRTVIVMIRS